MSKKIFLAVILVIIFSTFLIYIALNEQISRGEDTIQLPNKDFTEISYYGDNLSDTNGMRAFPWGIEIWSSPFGSGNEKPSSYFENGQVKLIGHSLEDVIVLAIPDPPDKPKVKGGLRYTQSFEIKLENVEGRGVRLIHQWFDSGDPLVHQIIGTQYGEFIKGSSDWQTVSLIGKAPLEAQRGDIIIELWGKGTVYIRNPRYHITTPWELIKTLSLKQLILWSIVILIIFLIITEILSLVSLTLLSLKDLNPKKIITFTLVSVLFLTTSVVKLSPSDISRSEQRTYDYNLIEDKYDTLLKNIHLLEFRGIDFFPRPNSYSTPAAKESLKELLLIPEVNYIQLRFFLFQETLESSEINLYQNQEKILTELIQEIHKKGKKVSIMPHILSRSNVYVANINPQDKDKWFESYTQCLLTIAKLAAKENVELFAVANELTNIMGDEKWYTVIEAIRQIYPGKITVKLNCWYKDYQFQNILSWKWLEKIDYIGIAAYFDLTNKNDPTKEELKQAWYLNRHKINIVSNLEQLSQKFGKPIIFSEIGYRNIDGANIEPWNPDALPPQSIKNLQTGKQDDEESILCTEALFETFKSLYWFKGTIWYVWPTAKLPAEDVSYSIRNKPILDTIIRIYREGR